MSKEMYAAPELELVDLGSEDVVCDSVTGGGNGTGSGDWETED